MKFIIPKNLYLENLIKKQETITIYRRVNDGTGKRYENAGTKTKSLLKHLPYCYYLIDLIIRKKERSKTNYIQLSTEILDKYIPKPTRIQVVSLLTTLEVIKVNSFYKEGQSMSYAMHENFTGTGFKTIVSQTKFDKKISTVYSKKTDDLLVNDHYPEYRFQKDKLLNIHFDEIGATKYVDGLFNRKEINKDQYDYMIYKIESISLGNPAINLNNTVNRFFSSITNLNKELRPFIKDSNGDDLIGIDFKSSHTFHLLSMILNNKKVPTSINTEKEGGMSPNVGTFFGEGKKMLNLAQTVGIYEYITEMHQQELNEKIDREKAKEIFINRFLYGQYPNQQLSKWVKSLFPEITKYIDNIGNDQLSSELMRSESKLLNNIIVRRIAIETPGATVYGIFDSILVDKKHFDEVYNIIIEESSRYFGFDSKLHVTEPKQNEVFRSNTRLSIDLMEVSVS